MADLMIPPATANSFLTANGWDGAEIVPVAGDASFRRYFRVIDGERKAILMDAPPPHEDPRPFISIASHLVQHGFAAPEILADDLSHGLVLIEDFGDHRMREHLDYKPEDESRIYGQTIDLLKDLAKAPVADVPKYDWAQYQREVSLLTEWYCPAQSLDVDEDSYGALWEKVLAPVLAAQKKPVTVLRDYHAENIMLLDNNRLGLLDFQDALAGHPAYDLVSMLQDARRDVSDELEAEMLERYLDGMRADDAEIFRSHYAILGAQRNAKIIGIFTRLYKRDGKPRYLDFLPRMWRLLEKDLQHPDLAGISAWFDTNIPAEIRVRPIEMESTSL